MLVVVIVIAQLLLGVSRPDHRPQRGNIKSTTASARGVVLLDSRTSDFHESFHPGDRATTSEVEKVRLGNNNRRRTIVSALKNCTLVRGEKTIFNVIRLRQGESERAL